MKRQVTNCEKLFVIHVPDQGYVQRIYKDLSKLNSKNTDNPIKTCKRFGHFTKQDIQMANKYTQKNA